MDGRSSAKGEKMKKAIVLALVLVLCMVGVAGAAHRPRMAVVKPNAVTASRIYTVRMMHAGEPTGYLTPRLTGPYLNGEWLESNLQDHMTIHNIGGPYSNISVVFTSIDGGTVAVESFGSGSVTLVGNFLATGVITVTLK